MVPSEMTRTSCVRTVERRVSDCFTNVSPVANLQVIEDGIVPLSECTVPTSFVVFVVEVSCFISFFSALADNPAGHMARDCRGRGDPNMAQNKQTQFDSEYSALMAELGEGAAPGAANVPAGAVTAAPTQDRLPPWRIPENWMPGESCRDV